MMIIVLSFVKVFVATAANVSAMQMNIFVVMDSSCMGREFRFANTTRGSGDAKCLDLGLLLSERNKFGCNWLKTSIDSWTMTIAYLAAAQRWTFSSVPLNHRFIFNECRAPRACVKSLTMRIQRVRLQCSWCFEFRYAKWALCGRTLSVSCMHSGHFKRNLIFQKRTYRSIWFRRVCTVQ